MKILVTGGAGFIGSHVVEYLLQAGYETVIVDNFQSGQRESVHPKAKLIEMDINSPLLESVFVLEKPDIVIHLAAQIDVVVSIKDPIYDAEQNILGTIRLLKYCQIYNVQKIIFASSCAVYGETEDCSIPESFPINPLSYYGLSKATSEKYIQLTHFLSQLRYTILRYANVYGPRQTINGEGGVVSVFFGKILNGETPTIFGDGEQTRDFVYVKDIAIANLLAVTKGDNEIINIGTDTKTSVKELLNMIMSVASFQTTPITLPAREGDIQHSRLNNTKAFTTLGWKPSFDLLTGLGESFSYYKSIN